MPGFWKRFLRRSSGPDLEKLKAEGDIAGLIEAMNAGAEKREQAAAALGQMGSAAIEPLIEGLKSTRSDARLGIIAALEQIGVPAVEPLIELLKVSDVELRQHAIQILGSIRDSRAVEGLIEALQAEERVIRWSAAGALGSVGDTRAIDSLMVALGDKEKSVREMAAVVLEMKFKMVVEDARLMAFEKLDLDKDLDGVRTAIRKGRNLSLVQLDRSLVLAKELGKAGDGRAVMPIITKAKAAHRLIDRIKGELGAAGIEGVIIFNVDGFYEALVEIGTPAIEALKAVLNDEDMKSYAGEALRKLGVR